MDSVKVVFFSHWGATLPLPAPAAVLSPEAFREPQLQMMSLEHQHCKWGCLFRAKRVGYQLIVPSMPLFSGSWQTSLYLPQSPIPALFQNMASVHTFHSGNI